MSRTGQDNRLDAELVKIVRARRRLVEFELIERAVLLGLTVTLLVATTVAMLFGELVLATAPAAGSILSGLLLRLHAERDER